jgi:hypothetical protein
MTIIKAWTAAPGKEEMNEPIPLPESAGTGDLPNQKKAKFMLNWIAPAMLPGAYPRTPVNLASKALPQALKASPFGQKAGQV